jgi:copper chaperone CopZ
MTTVEVLNLKCHGCANTITKGLLSLEEINEVAVDVENSKVYFDNEDKEVLIFVKEKLEKMGYPEVGDSNTIIHKAKSFVSCATGRMTSED